MLQHRWLSSQASESSCAQERVTPAVCFVAGTTTCVAGTVVPQVLQQHTLWIQGAVLPGSSDDFARSLPSVPLANCFCQAEFARLIRAIRAPGKTAIKVQSALLLPLLVAKLTTLHDTATQPGTALLLDGCQLPV